MTAPAQAIGAMSSGRVFLGELLSSRARLRFPGQPQAPTITPVRRPNRSERQTRTSLTVSPKGVTPTLGTSVRPVWRGMSLMRSAEGRVAISNSDAHRTTVTTELPWGVCGGEARHRTRDDKSL